MFFIEQIKNNSKKMRSEMQGFTRLRYTLPSTLILLTMLVYSYHQAWTN